MCFHEWRPVDKKGIAVNSLIFHSEQPTWLFCKYFSYIMFRKRRSQSKNIPWTFCHWLLLKLNILGGTSDGVVSLWDIGQHISLPSYDGVNPQQLLKVIHLIKQVYYRISSGCKYSPRLRESRYKNRLFIVNPFLSSYFLIMVMYIISHGVEQIDGCWPVRLLALLVGI